MQIRCQCAWLVCSVALDDLDRLPADLPVPQNGFAYRRDPKESPLCHRQGTFGHPVLPQFLVPARLI